ncbi:hypothetical protein ACS0TY_026444 [Phlomoides rotata]
MGGREDDSKVKGIGRGMDDGCVGASRGRGTLDLEEELVEIKVGPTMYCTKTIFEDATRLLDFRNQMRKMQSF